MVDFNNIGEKIIIGVVGFLAGAGVTYVAVNYKLSASLSAAATKAYLTLTPSTVTKDQIVQANLSGFAPNSVIHVASWVISSGNLTFVTIDWGSTTPTGTLLYEFQALQNTFPQAGNYPIIAFDDFGNTAIAWLIVTYT